MGDLISRKAAIEKIVSLKRERNPLTETDRAMNYILEVAASCLYYLPSAQPEITLESAIDYLHSIGWMQEHDRALTESAQPNLQPTCNQLATDCISRQAAMRGEAE